MAVGIRSEGAAAIRGIPRLTLGMAGDLFGDLFRRLIKPLFGYPLFVRFNELSLVQFGLNLNFCRGIPRSTILFAVRRTDGSGE